MAPRSKPLPAGLVGVKGRRVTVARFALLMGKTRSALYANPRLMAFAKPGKRGLEFDLNEVQHLLPADVQQEPIDPLLIYPRWVTTQTMCFLLDCSATYLLRDTQAPRHYLENGSTPDKPGQPRWDPDEVFAYFDRINPPQIPLFDD